MFDIQKVGATQVRVALRFSGPEACGIKSDLDRRVLRVPRVKLEAAADILEVSPNVGDHHVPGTKLGCSVSWFKYPFRHLGISRYEILRSIPPPARNLQDGRAAVAGPVRFDQGRIFGARRAPQTNHYDKTRPRRSTKLDRMIRQASA